MTAVLYCDMDTGAMELRQEGEMKDIEKWQKLAEEAQALDTHKSHETGTPCLCVDCINRRALYAALPYGVRALLVAAREEAEREGER